MANPGSVKVSVNMVTYNHEPYIAQAIESVLAQELEARFELVIGEDGSTDRTGEIVQDYARRHPDVIRVMPDEGNLGVMKNWMRILRACRGDYLAILDGDDYWSSPHKLGKQVALLDRQPDLALCCHICIEESVDGSRAPYTWPSPSDRTRYRLADLARAPICNSSTLMFRRRVIEELPEWFEDAPVGDWTLQVLSARHGDVGFLNEAMSHHRNHAGGVYGGTDSPRKFQKLLDNRRMFAPLLPADLQAAVREGDFHSHYRKSRAHERLGEIDEALRSLAYCRAHLADAAGHSRFTLWKRAWRLQLKRWLGIRSRGS